MVYSTNKVFVAAMAVCITALLAVADSTGTAQEPASKKILQPQGLNHAGIHQLRQAEPSLTGKGVTVGVISRSISYIEGEPQNDYRPDVSHNCLREEQFGFHDGSQPAGAISPHSTAICSILLGADSNGFTEQAGEFDYEGAAPAVKAKVYEFWYFLINNVFTFTMPEANIVTASFGTDSQDWWTRGIESLAEHYGITVTAGIGNGTDAYDTALYPAAGSNVIGVGVVDSVNSAEPATALANFALAYPRHSSTGPTADGRCKPDIVAPGNCLVAAVNEPDSYKATGNWSSFSTPMVAGTIALLVQKAQQDPNLSSAISQAGGNCVMKAILMSSARKLPYWHKGLLKKDDDHTVPLDYVQGAGMLDAVSAYEILTAGQNDGGKGTPAGWDLNTLERGRRPEKVYKLAVSQPKDEFITATVVWNRHYESVYPFEPLAEKDANLRLELWAVDANDPNKDYMLDYSDSQRDNVEHIYCRADGNYANYELAVLYSDIEEPNSADTGHNYAVAWQTTEGPDHDDILWYDLNADGIVNDSDVLALLNSLAAGMAPREGYLFGDINEDGIINIADLQILANHLNLRADWYKE